jgi:hypothetical protein
MRRPLTTLMTLVLVSTLLMGFAAGPAAAQCVSVAEDGSSAVTVNAQTSVGVQVANNIQTGVAVSVEGDASVSQDGTTSQSSVVVQTQC